MEFRSITFVDQMLYYMTLLIVDIGINDIETKIARHKDVFSSFTKIIKLFFHKTYEKEE